MRNISMRKLYLLLPFIIISCIRPANYPYQPPSQLVEEATQLSKALEQHVIGFLDGKLPAKIPNALIPKGIDTAQNSNFYVQKYEELDPQQQWAVREEEPIDHQRVKAGLPDPHVTYLLLGTSLAPFGSKVVIEGEYPYCRFFSIQMSPPFDGASYCINRVMGPAEVSIADVDIDPMAGSINPFVVGNNRNAKNRKYRVEISLATGNAVVLNPDFKPPYKMQDNQFHGGLIQNQGPKYKTFKAKGPWNMGAVWVRYYAPDPGKGPMAGVPLPKIHYELPDGRRYFINSDYSGMEAVANMEQPAKANKPYDPKKTMGPEVGWFKSFGILRSGLVGALQVNGWINEKRLQKMRNYDLGATGRGEGQPAPRNYEPSSTSNNYITYLGRPMALGPGKVIVLTGKLPTFPDTRNGLSIMQNAQLRYYSISGYDINVLRKTIGSVNHSVMDDEIILTKDRRYMIVYSRAQDRPVNAIDRNGATWVDWGPTTDLGLMVRWLSVSPNFEMSPNPHETQLPYATTDLGGSQYNAALLGHNNHEGYLGEYLPRIHYMSKADFEALGNQLDSRNIPIWENLKGNGQ